MQELLQEFPRPLLVVDGGLRVLGFSAKIFSVIGLRKSKDTHQAYQALDRALQSDGQLGDELALATARLVRSGDEDRLVWTHRKRTFEVTVHARSDGSFWVLFEDITDYAVSEKILVSARRYLERVMSHIPLGVIVLNSDLRISSMNGPSRAFTRRLGGNLSPVDAIGETLEMAIPAPAGEHWHALCQRALQNETRQELVRQTYDASNKSPCVLSILATPLPDPQRIQAGIVLVVEDVTEKVRLEDQLVDVEKLATVGQMAVTIKHEINNPLSIILTNAQMLRMREVGGGDNMREKLLRIEEQVRRIADVTERLRMMEEVATEEYVRGGAPMIDLWKDQPPISETEDENL